MEMKMKFECLFMAFVLCLMFTKASSKETALQKLLQKRTVAVNFNAYSDDINTCLFTGWTKLPAPVLSGNVQCAGTKLCYGTTPGTTPTTALYASCYNTKTLIPEFTGNVVKSNINGSGRPKGWRKDNGKQYAPNPQAVPDDYSAVKQIRDHPTWDLNKGYFCSRGHLTPNSDFSTLDERKMTFIVTNVAPQWQKFNGGNWAVIERAVAEYAKSKTRDVYVFTGIGGEAKDNSGVVMKLNNRVLIPKWYWKAVCDPIAKESIIFVAQNNVGDMKTTKVNGCNGNKQTSDQGVVFCYSLDVVSKMAEYSDFKLPPFDKTNCKPSQKGTFMDGYLGGLA